MPRQSKRDLKGCGYITIKDTPGPVEETFDSNEIINKIDKLKEALLKSRLKVDNYNLSVHTPKDPKKGYRLPKYMKDRFNTPEEYRAYKKFLKSEEKGKEKLQNKENRKTGEKSAKQKRKDLNNINSIIDKNMKGEKLTEQDYEDLVKYNETLKNNPLNKETSKDNPLKRKYNSIKKIIDGKFEKKETKEEKQEIKPETKQEEKPEIKQEEIKPEPKPEKQEETNPETKPEEKPKPKRGRPKGSKNKKGKTEEKPKPKRGRPKGSKNKKGKTEDKKGTGINSEDFGIKFFSKYYKN